MNPKYPFIAIIHMTDRCNEKCTMECGCNYKPQVERDQITGEPVINNIDGFVRAQDVHHIELKDNPAYNKDAE